MRTLVIDSDFAEQVMATSHAIVLFLNRDGRIELFNGYMRELCGYSLDEVHGRDWFEQFIPEPERAHLRELFKAALGQTSVRAHVNAIVTRSGELRQIEWWANAVHNDRGEIIGVVSFGHDIDDKLQLRAKLSESERLANIGMLASVFAHEVGNPLNAIYLQLQLLQRRIDKPDRGPLRPQVESILAEVKRLNTLLEDFRAYRDPSQIQLELTDLGPVLRDVSTLMSVRGDERDVTLACELQEPLPQVLGNANKLKQVLINLCKNGMEAMPHGGQLQLSARVVEQRVCIEITDQGNGIPDGVDVFAPFSTTKPSGMGLGLPLAREIVQAHAGELDYRSEPGVGTTFVVTIPCAGSS